ncbi:hypothetical protein N431DRAFT_396406 [Stipitochalara longipes BDJ]|nr:hypothetical protein N431DRAFT_396406 [Stipitochalara longipes BDJ]
MAPILEKFAGSDITDEMISQAASLFSSHYGVWGSVAAEKMGVKQGSRVKISPNKLRADILPPLPVGAQHILIRALLPNTTSPIAHIFATSYAHHNRPMLWPTQLVVHSSHRNQGIAKALLQSLREGNEEQGMMIGVLSSNAFTIAAVLRVFGQGIERVEEVVETTRRNAGEVMASCPVSYVKTAKLRGSLYESAGEDRNEDGGVVSCADTGFWVDHQEPEKALRVLEEKGVEWPLGKLPEGCEFLVLVEVRKIGRIEPLMMQGFEWNPEMMDIVSRRVLS